MTRRPSFVPLALVVACAAPEPGASYWSEFLTPAEVTATLPLLEDEGAGLNQQIQLDGAGLDPWLDVLRDAESRGVPTALWPLLSREAGYWANQGNAQRFTDATLALLDRALAEDLETRVVWVDLEMDIRRVERLRAATSSTATTSPIEVLFEGVDDMAFDRAFEAFARLIREAHAREFEVYVTTLVFLVDDAEDGDESIARVLGTPLRDLAWDRVSFQVYRTQLPELAGPILGDPSIRFTPALIHEYAQSAVALYGERAAIDLGLIAGGGVTNSAGFDDPRELALDRAASEAAGIPWARTQIYALDGVRGEAAWIALPRDAAPSVSAADEATTRLRERVRGLDALFR